MSEEEAKGAQEASDLLTRLAFSIHENRGVYALVVGSGLSRAAGIPTGWEITLDLIRRVARGQEVAEQDDWAGWYRGRFGREPDYSEIVEELGGSPEERRSILEGYIEPTAEERAEGRKVPTAAHRAIADLVHDGLVRVLVTTNFDRLLENALRDRGVEPTVVDSDDALQGAVPLTHAPCYLVKLHGDYKDARIRNTDEELANYPAAFNALLDRIFDEHGLVVCGWSAEWDEALRRAMTRAPSRRYSLFWAVRGEPGDAARRIVEERRGYFVPIGDADEFFGKLRDRVQTLVETRRRDPRNVELLVNVAKRFVAKPECRVELDDLVESEVETLVARLRSSTPSANADADGIRVLTTFYESAAEPLGRVAGALGRWGDGNEVAGVVNALLALVQQADEVRAGVTSLLYLRAYPAVLLLACYGLGLTHAGRWEALHRLLSHPLQRAEGEPGRVVDKLFLWTWDGGDDRIWHQLQDLGRHHTPLSDHLCTVMDGWRASFAAVVGDFEDLYDTWEILGSLVFCETLSTEQLEAEDGAFWAPVGRNGWRRSIDRVVRRIATGDGLEALVSAGFGAGSPERLAASVKRYARFSSGIRWR